MISTNLFNCSRKGLYRRPSFKPQLWSWSLYFIIMFKAIKKTIKAWYFRRLLLRIYFSYLNHPNTKILGNSLDDALFDYRKIKRLLTYKAKT